MNIRIAGQDFTFDDESAVKTESNGYDLYVVEPGFDTATEKMEHQFTSKSITLPASIEGRVNRNSTEQPCSKVYKDAAGKKRLYTYFD